MAFSLYPQFATDGGGKPVWLVVYYPTLAWRPFTDTAAGSGKLDVVVGHQTYYSRTNTGDQSARLGLITFTNEWTNDNLELSTIAYTHTLPGDLNLVSVTVGQYSLFNFDPNQYAANAQTSFIGFALSQDATQTAPDAGLGTYLKVRTPDDQFSLAGGVQGASNLAADRLTTDGLSSSKRLSWGNVQWTPKSPDLGAGLYSVLYYVQPFIEGISSHSVGVSFSASQEIGERWGAFLRLSNATGSDIAIKTSLAFGGVRNDPFGRNPTDRLGVGAAVNKTNRAAIGDEPAGSRETDVLTTQGPRNHEWMSEVFYNYTVSKAIRITPDAQVFWNPALGSKKDPEAVFTLRTTLFF
jgi:hypothetical protein